MSSTASLSFAAIEGVHAHEQWARLLDRCFPVVPGRHFLEDFPLWDEGLTQELPTRKILRLGAWQDQKLIAAAGCCTALLRWKGGVEEEKEVPVALIGAVVTDPLYRGQGLASQLVERLRDWAAQQGAWAVFLWGSDPAFYARLGFEHKGSQVQIPLASLEEKAAPFAADLRSSQEWVFHEGWSASLGELLLQARQEGLRLQEADLKWVAAHQGIQWHWAASSKAPKTAVAYAAYGKGIDLQGFVHEWGGDPQAILGLLQKITALNPGALLLTNPVLFEKFWVKFKFFGTASVDEGIPREPLCLARILKPKEWEAQWGTLEFPPGLWLGGLDSV